MLRKIDIKNPFIFYCGILLILNLFSHETALTADNSVACSRLKKNMIFVLKGEPWVVRKITKQQNGSCKIDAYLGIPKFYPDAYNRRLDNGVSFGIFGGEFSEFTPMDLVDAIRESEEYPKADSPVGTTVRLPSHIAENLDLPTVNGYSRCMPLLAHLENDQSLVRVSVFAGYTLGPNGSGPFPVYDHSARMVASSELALCTEAETLIDETHNAVERMLEASDALRVLDQRLAETEVAANDSRHKVPRHHAEDGHRQRLLIAIDRAIEDYKSRSEFSIFPKYEPTYTAE